MSFDGAKFVWMNGEIIPWEQATVHVMSHALHYGSSVFEGIRVAFCKYGASQTQGAKQRWLASGGTACRATEKRD